jgi:hypothetical protein
MSTMTSSYFRNYQDYRGGTDADHVPVIPGNDFPTDPSHQDESPLDRPAPGDADMAKPQSANSLSLEIDPILPGRVKPHNHQPNRSVACPK